MTSAPVRLALRRSLRDVRHVRAVRPRHATGVVAEVYRQVERDFGLLAPPIALHSPAPDVLAAAWLLLRESLVVPGAASRAEKEAMATAVSRANACPYCVEVHGTALAALDAAPDHTLPRGPADARHRELVAVAVTFHYLNRMVNVFLGPSPLPAAVPDAARDTVRAVLGRVLRPAADAVPGAALSLLPAAGTVPDDLSWAAGPIRSVFARACAAVTAAGRSAVPEPVRALTAHILSTWDGKPPGPSRAWLEPAVADLPGEHRPVARLVLLVALSSAQVDDGIVAEARRRAPEDRTLVEMVAWASLAAARTVGARMSHDGTPEGSVGSAVA